MRKKRKLCVWKVGSRKSSKVQNSMKEKVDRKQNMCGFRGHSNEWNCFPKAKSAAIKYL
jgi:hypothetical protein